MAQYILLEALRNTLVLSVGVAILSGVVGVALAWLVAVYEFPGRRVFSWALLLPMAMPGYVMAFAYSSLFEYAGPLHRFGRTVFGADYELPDIGPAAASILTLGLVLYPYVYLIVREAFASQGLRSIEVAQSCGYRPLQGFFKVSLPLARPFIVAGVGLAVMETLADFGTVKIYNLMTFTTAIYQSWFALFSLEAALQLSLVLIALVVFALLVERLFRGNAQYRATGGKAHTRISLRGSQAFAATAICGLVLLIAFIVPASLIAHWSLLSFGIEFDQRYWSFATNSILLASMAAGVIGVTALLLAFATRQRPTTAVTLLSRAATLGYAIPGTVLAIGFFVAVAAVSRGLSTALTGDPAAIALQGGLLVVMLAYLSRYLMVAHNPMDSALSRIGTSLEDASRGMGVAGLRMLRFVHLPMLRPAIVTAVLLVFVDVMKELPITLMTRPFGWDTLAVRVFQLTTEGEWQRAALPALAIVVAGLLPVLILTRYRDRA